MDKRYEPGGEEAIYKLWEKSQAFTPKIDKKKKPYTIILPPPNANNPLHAGHALYTVEDILVRFHRMLGDPTLWLPGTDHAGIETQFVFEKELQKDGQSRFDYDRNTLFKLISKFVEKNKDISINQLKRLGFSLDWTRLKFTLDPDHTKRIYAVFRKMVADNLVYRDEKIVNYCTFCGTSFSNLEVNHKTVNSHLWYINYAPGLTVATTRPETMLGDTAVAVNPSDKRYKKLIGTTINLPIVNRQIPIIADDMVDPEFGTGAVKVTPAHSPEDFDLAKKHHLKIIRIFNYDGQSNQNVPKKYRHLFPKQVRSALIKDLEEMGLLEKTVDYTHQVGHCYKCGNPIEPITAPQWFIKIKSLAKPAIKAVKNDQIKIFPKRFKKQYLQWMKNIRDWNISRQIVWGHRIPVYYDLDQNPDIFITFIDSHKNIITNTWAKLKDKYSYQDIISGLQTLTAPADAKYFLTSKEAGQHSIQETDTFDTWFSSGQWPYSTLGWDPDGHHGPDFDYFYPTTVLDTMWDILFFWVARMIMMGLYTTGKIPFKVAHMHSRVLAGDGQKMSKSRGNAINPTDIAGEFGADALRLALVYGVAPGSDIALSMDKIKAQRNFVNKIYNAARFVEMLFDRHLDASLKLNPKKFDQSDQSIIKKLNQIIASTTKNINFYRFGQASEDLYQFFWHDFCDIYIESAKDRPQDSLPVLATVLVNSLKLLHPFAPFVTESIYQSLKDKLRLTPDQLITAQWPNEIKI